MHKIIFFALGLAGCSSSLFAGHELAEDLVASLEHAVLTAAKGDVASASREINAEARVPKGLKELGAQSDTFKAIYQKLGALGEFDGVERVSLRYTGDSFLRLRVADKRAEGVVLWTFVGYKFKGQWYCKGMTFNGSDDLMQLMHQELDASDAR